MGDKNPKNIRKNDKQKAHAKALRQSKKNPDAVEA